MAAEVAGCLVQFAKAPVPGTVKTRLAASVGEEGAAALAADMTVEVSNALGRASDRWPAVLCVDDPSHALFRSLHEADGRSVWTQGEGDLGERMDRACRRALATFPAVILVGSDCPGYDAGYLQRAMRTLESGVPAVLGPAVDGGYVLIGLRRCPDGVFRDIPWSSSAVVGLQRARFTECGLAWEELPPRADVDRPGDLWMLRPA